jgi:hypothetical protein
MAQPSHSSPKPTYDRSEIDNSTEGAFVLLMAIVPTTFFAILVLILALNP